MLSGFIFTVNSKYFFNSWCCILDYFILNFKLWDKFFNSMIILNLIISVLQKFWINLWIYGTEEGPLYVAETFALLSFWVFLYLIVKILIEENKKNLTLCQNNEKWKKKILWILGQYNSRHVIKHVPLKLFFFLYDWSLNFERHLYRCLAFWKSLRACDTWEK